MKIIGTFLQKCLDRNFFAIIFVQTKTKTMKRKKIFVAGRLPKSIEEALNGHIKVIGLDVKATNKNLKENNLEPYR